MLLVTDQSGPNPDKPLHLSSKMAFIMQRWGVAGRPVRSTGCCANQRAAPCEHPGLHYVDVCMLQKI